MELRDELAKAAMPVVLEHALKVMAAVPVADPDAGQAMAAECIMETAAMAYAVADAMIEIRDMDPEQEEAPDEQ